MFCLSMFIRKRQTLTGCSRRYYLDESTFIFRGFLGASGVFFHFISFPVKIIKANRIAQDGTSQSAASHQGLLCLPMFHKGLQAYMG